MKIAVDRNIPYAQEAFSTLGEITTFQQDEIVNKSLLPFDALIIRSTCRVDENLLKNTRISFVGSTTIGQDHIDHDYLTKHRIAFANAPGCNAEAVGEFVVNAIIQHLNIKKIPLTEQRLGIIGAGNTGSALKRKAEAIGLKVYQCDPPLQLAEKRTDLINLPEIIEKANIISLHVPLIKSGNFPTHHLINNDFCKSIRKKVTLINTSRGEVVDQRTVAQHRHIFTGLIFDVWEYEPHISTEILSITDIGTPHIAGYSQEGKLRATKIIYEKFCKFLQIDQFWSPSSIEGGQIKHIMIEDENIDLTGILKLAYNIYDDDKTLRKLSSSNSPSTFFKDLRNNYLYRTEFRNYHIYKSEKLPKTLRKTLNNLGFSTFMGLP